jgi:hypothetical protein
MCLCRVDGRVHFSVPLLPVLVSHHSSLKEPVSPKISIACCLLRVVVHASPLFRLLFTRAGQAHKGRL